MGARRMEELFERFPRFPGVLVLVDEDLGGWLGGFGPLDGDRGPLLPAGSECRDGEGQDKGRDGGTGHNTGRNHR
jgi:hypothetical protein